MKMVFAKEHIMFNRLVNEALAETCYQEVSSSGVLTEPSNIEIFPISLTLS